MRQHGHPMATFPFIISCNGNLGSVNFARNLILSFKVILLFNSYLFCMLQINITLVNKYIRRTFQATGSSISIIEEYTKTFRLFKDKHSAALSPT